MILCFSGTGNSRFCADYLADRLQDEVADLFPALRSGAPGDFHSDRPWVFVSPTYAWQIPHLLRDFLRSTHFSGARQAYFIMTCGSDTGAAHQKNDVLCREVGLQYMGTLEVIMPENYIALFDAPEQSQAHAIIRMAQPVLQAGADQIAAGEPIPPHPHRFGDDLKSGLVNRAFYPLMVKAKAFTVSDACIHCGKCAAACVTGNIELISGEPVWGRNCTHCMACICGCPAGAIEYGTSSRGKPRYQCPPYQKSESVW